MLAKYKPLLINFLGSTIDNIAFESAPNPYFYRPQTTSEETAPDENASEAGNSHTELSVLEKDCCKQNFQFYDKAKQGFVERFELPMVLTSKF